MSGRKAKFVPAIFVNILAGLLLATVARGQPATAEGCLSAPWGDAPAGSQWRYHLDHANKTKCWYLRRASEGLSQASPQSSSPAPQISAPTQSAKPSVADAHAELRRAPPREDNQAPSPAANPAVNEAPSASTSVWNATAAVATRWPDPPAAARLAPSAAPTTVTVATEASKPSADPAQAILPSIPFTRLSVPVRPETILTLIAAAVGALAFAGIAAWISRRGRNRRLRGRVTRSTRGPISDTTDDDRIILSDQPYPDSRDYRPRFGRSAAAMPASKIRKREFASRAPKYARR